MPFPTDDRSDLESSVVRRWLLLLGIWGTVATFSALQIYLSRRAIGMDVPLGPLVRMEFPIWAYWVAASVGIVMFSRRCPLDRVHMLRSTSVHLLLASLISAGYVAYHVLWYQAFNPFPYTSSSPLDWYWRSFRQEFILGFVLYWAVVGTYHAFANYARFRRQEADLSEATLYALRLQLRPHFLFNALNTVPAVMERDPRLARRVISRLGDLLRASLRESRVVEVTLGEELDLVRAYVEIEEARFGNRLTTTMATDPRLQDVLVPSLLLQPLVENAFRHGLGPRGGGHVLVTTAQDAGQLCLRVDDDGVGASAPELREGVGLGNTRRRLHTLFGDAASLGMPQSALGGFAVEVRLPLRRALRARVS